MATQEFALRRQRTLRVEAVILRHSEWGETDRLLWLYTLEIGKVRAVAKGVRKPRSRKTGHLQPFMRSNLLLERGRDLPLVTQAETVDAFLPLREDVLLTSYASYVVELLDRFTYEEGQNRQLYRLLIDTLARLCQLSTPELAVRYYEVRLLDLVGYRPQLFSCAQCEAEILAQDQYFSAQLGGVLCPKCGLQSTGMLTVGSRAISVHALKYLRHFQRSNFTEASRAKLTPAINREIENLMQHYLTYLLERRLNTPPFIRRARQADASQADSDELNE